MAGPLTAKKAINRGNIIRDATIRDFSGGWNEIDNDLNLSTKYSKVLKNLQLQVDGSIGVRFGTKLFADTSVYLDKILNMEYYSGHIIAVGSNGKIVRINSVGEVILIWDDTWAATLPGSPSGWSSGLTVVNFAVFNGFLVVVNGVNKPLMINTGLTVTYLNDLATGSNLNAPITRYVRAHSRYLVFAGDLLAPSVLYITSIDTIGTFYGDPAPNDGVNVDLSSRVPSGEVEITGLGRYRDQLVVSFNDVLIPGTLGIYDASGNHVPTFDDALEEHGSISHRAIHNLGDDMLFADNVGVPSISRALFTGSLRPQRESSLIDPAIQRQINKVDTIEGLLRHVFAVYDSIQGNYMLFIPSHADAEYSTETKGFIYKKQKELKIAAWSEFIDWNWSCATKSALKRVFFAKDANVYLYGDRTDPFYADYIGEQETFDDGETFTDQLGWTPVGDINTSGVPIRFEWELPWTDAGERFLKKASKYVNLDTVGTGRFKLQMFTDNIYKDKLSPGETFTDGTIFTDGTGWDVDTYIPILEMEFTGGDSEGYGGDPFGNYYGSGRPTAFEGLYAWTMQHKISKFRIIGETMAELRFISITHAYTLGSA